MLSSFRLFCIQFKEVNILWRPGPENANTQLNIEKAK